MNYKTTALNHNHQRSATLNSVSPAKVRSVNSSVTNSPNVPSRKGNFTIKQRYPGDSSLQNYPPISPPVEANLATPASDLHSQLQSKRSCPW